MNILASLRRLVKKTLPFPAHVDVRFARASLRVDEDGDSEAVYDVSIDGEVVFTATLCLPPHDPACDCDLAGGLRRLVTRALLGRLADGASSGRGRVLSPQFVAHVLSQARAERAAVAHEHVFGAPRKREEKPS